jgi:hypothetical protein
MAVEAEERDMERIIIIPMMTLKPKTTAAPTTTTRTLDHP